MPLGLAIKVAAAADDGGDVPGNYPTDAYIPTAADPWTPNFTRNPTIYSRHTGAWSNPATWDLGRVPQAGDTVGIKDTHSVTYDVDATTALIGVGVAGSLIFRTDLSTQLWFTNLVVYSTGLLKAGDTVAPMGAGVTAQFVVRDVALDTGTTGSPGTDPAGYGTGVIIQGSVQTCGQAKTGFRRLAGTASAGATSLTLNTAPSNWAVGDEVVVADSRLRVDIDPWSTAHPRFRTTITSTSGTALGIALALDNDRPRATYADGSAAAGLTAHVGNLTRNVIFRSENPSGTRGHIILEGAGVGRADFRYTRFEGLGRTTGEALNDTAFDGSGNATQVGTNQRGRYPLHFHHLQGTSHYRYTVIGCSFDPGTDGDHHRKWPIAVHETHYGLLDSNLCWNWEGAGIALEDGTEIENVIQNNAVIYVASAPSSSGRADSSFPGREGDGYWAQTGRNRYTGNVAVNCGLTGFTFFNDGGQNNYGTGGYLQFDGNETYGGRNGMTNWYMNGADTGAADPNAPVTFLDNHTVWNCWEFGYGLGYPTINVTWRGWLCLNGTGRQGNAWEPGDYLHKGCSVENCRFEGYYIGVFVPDKQDGTFLVKGCTLKCYHNLYNETPAGPGGGGGFAMVPRATTVQNCTFANSGSAIGGEPTDDVWMRFYGQPSGNNAMISDSLTVIDYNGVSAANFHCYFAAQAPSFVPPASDNIGQGNVASPEAGKTNQQLHDKYIPYAAGTYPTVKSDNPNPATPGLCVSNELMPSGADTTTRPKITGYTKAF